MPTPPIPAKFHEKKWRRKAQQTQEPPRGINLPGGSLGMRSSIVNHLRPRRSSQCHIIRRYLTPIWSLLTSL